jgi:hypothetical protein
MMMFDMPMAMAADFGGREMAMAEDDFAPARFMEKGVEEPEMAVEEK